MARWGNSFEKYYFFIQQFILLAFNIFLCITFDVIVIDLEIEMENRMDKYSYIEYPEKSFSI